MSRGRGSPSTFPKVGDELVRDDGTGGEGAAQSGALPGVEATVHSRSPMVGGDRDAVAFVALGQDLEKVKSSQGGWLVGART